MSARSNGGKTANANKTPEQRKAHAAMMMEAKRRKALLPRVYRKRDPLVLGDVKIPCAVVEDPVTKEKIRVITERGITYAISRSNGSGTAKRVRRKELQEGGAKTPLFLADAALKPFVLQRDLGGAIEQKITYLDELGEEQEGYNVLMLTATCRVWRDANRAGVLTPSQKEKALRAEALLDAIEDVGIIAMVDEATGYQEERTRGELAETLNKFLDRNLRTYTAQFPLHFYQQLARLYGVQLPEGGESGKRPLFFAGRTLDIVYDRLAPDLVEALKTIKGETKVKLHQALSEQHGIVKLQAHLAVVVTLMELSDTKEQFYELLNRIRPRLNSDVSPEISRDDTI